MNKKKYAKRNTNPVRLEYLFQAGSQQLYWGCATWFAMFCVNFVEEFEKFIMEIDGNIKKWSGKNNLCQFLVLVGFPLWCF